MLEIVLKADDPIIGKIANDEATWPATDVVGQPYQRITCTCYTLPAPTGEHWFVVLPEGISEFSIKVVKAAKVKGSE